MKLTRAEKSEQERQTIRQGFMEELMANFGMSEKEADEYLDIIQVFCAQFFDDYMRRKRIDVTHLKQAKEGKSALIKTTP